MGNLLRNSAGHLLRNSAGHLLRNAGLTYLECAPYSSWSAETVVYESTYSAAWAALQANFDYTTWYEGGSGSFAYTRWREFEEEPRAISAINCLVFQLPYNESQYILKGIRLPMSATCLEGGGIPTIGVQVNEWWPNMTTTQYSDILGQAQIDVSASGTDDPPATKTYMLSSPLTVNWQTIIKLYFFVADHQPPTVDGQNKLYVPGSFDSVEFIL